MAHYEMNNNLISILKYTNWIHVIYIYIYIYVFMKYIKKVIMIFENYILVNFDSIIIN